MSAAAADTASAARWSWFEASARERVRFLLDPDTFEEILGPEARETSPHLGLFDLPPAFDDGVVIGTGRLSGRAVLIAAQEGRFMGGTIGEVSGAKITGLLRAARDRARAAAANEAAPVAVLLALDTGGVRLQEANAGELAVSEILRAIVEARDAGAVVVALVGGRSGAFGGGGIIAATCTRVVISAHGRIGVTGPEVIETNRGVEEFDSRDRALIWRITGGRTRRLLGGADLYVEDRIGAFREAARAALDAGSARLDPDLLEAERRRLARRLEDCGDASDAPEIWHARAIPDPDRVADLDETSFATLCAANGPKRGAR